MLLLKMMPRCDANDDDKKYKYEKEEVRNCELFDLATVFLMLLHLFLHCCVIDCE